MLKPLLCWAGADAEPFRADPTAWAALARPAVTVSDNAATAELWSWAGGERLLASIEDRTGVAWRVDDGGPEHPALRVLVTAGELARAYAALAADADPVAARVRDWMRRVPAAQAFGVRRVAGELLGVPEAAVAVKCGWFGLARAHAVALVELTERTLGAAVTTAWPPDPVGRAAVAPERIVAAHEALAGPTLRAGIRRGLLAAGCPGPPPS